MSRWRIADQHPRPSALGVPLQRTFQRRLTYAWHSIEARQANRWFGIRSSVPIGLVALLNHQFPPALNVGLCLFGVVMVGAGFGEN
jgi:hypothetical protein